MGMMEKWRETSIRERNIHCCLPYVPQWGTEPAIMHVPGRELNR